MSKWRDDLVNQTTAFVKVVEAALVAADQPS
jgi:hypothetical protein